MKGFGEDVQVRQVYVGYDIVQQSAGQTNNTSLSETHRLLKIEEFSSVMNPYEEQMDNPGREWQFEYTP